MKYEKEVDEYMHCSITFARRQAFKWWNSAMATLPYAAAIQSVLISFVLGRPAKREEM